MTKDPLEKLQEYLEENFPDLLEEIWNEDLSTEDLAIACFELLQGYSAYLEEYAESLEAGEKPPEESWEDAETVTYSEIGGFAR